jgi:hypothetical protein
MSNIIDYLKWRGDLSFEINPINEIDNIILARFSYLPFHDIYIEPKENIKSIAKKMRIIPKTNFVWEEDKKFIEELSKTRRYQNLIVSDYVQKLDLDTETQFRAITIWLPNAEKYISFEGTDMTIVGWKEDFNMSFMTNIPAQIEAVKYLEKIADKYTGNFRLGGHSKGGNLAVYAATFCKDEIKERIIDILNADGPGFNKETISDERYKNIVNKVNTYVPQSSIIGRLLEHEEKYNIVKSTQKGVMQHDIYSWQVEATELIKIPELTNESKMVNKIVRDWLNSTTPEQRKNFINALYQIIGKTEAKTITEFSEQWLKNIKKIIETYKTMSEEEKKQMEQMIKLTLNSIATCVKKEILGKNKKSEEI